MVCIYCGAATRVTNSRKQRRSNSIWRRRLCLQCKGLYTTLEHVALEHSVRFATKDGTLVPFSRDQLFMSLMEACKHRPAALDEASSLAELIIGRLVAKMPEQQAGLLARDAVATACHTALLAFDTTAAAVYLAVHPIKKLPTIT